MNLSKTIRADVLWIVNELGGTNVRVFGSVATAQEHQESDIDLIINIEAAKNALRMPEETKTREIERIKIRAADIAGELKRLLRRDVHVMIEELLRPSQRRNILEQAVVL